ncbi:MAG: class I SAM-dependent methyltransferase [Acidimicrobiales bacterium]
MTAAANDRHWFEALAEHMGPAYLRYSFTKGTRQEVASLVELLGLEPGQRVLDVGCGPGRHSLALAELGFDVVGVDIAERFVRLANEAAVSSGLDERATFTVADARALPFDGEFDAVISLCQGAFGLAGGAGAHPRLPRRELDEPILDGIARALRPRWRRRDLGLLGLLPDSLSGSLRHLRCRHRCQPRNHRGPRSRWPGDAGGSLDDVLHASRASIARPGGRTRTGRNTWRDPGGVRTPRCIDRLPRVLLLARRGQPDR